LVIDEVAEERAVGGAGLAHGGSWKKYFPDITMNYAI
jgi:hypothetical protein